MNDSMEELQREIGVRVAMLNAAERLKVSQMVLTILKCFGENPEAEAALVAVEEGQLQVIGINNDQRNTLHMFCTAHEMLHNNGIFAEPGRGMH